MKIFFRRNFPATASIVTATRFRAILGHSVTTPTQFGAYRKHPTRTQEMSDSISFGPRRLLSQHHTTMPPNARKPHETVENQDPSFVDGRNTADQPAEHRRARAVRHAFDGPG